MKSPRKSSKRTVITDPPVTIVLTWKQASLVEHQIEKAASAWDEPWACRQAHQVLARIENGFRAAIRASREGSK